MDMRSLNDTYLITSWSGFLLREANRFPPSQEIHRILWNPKVRYLIQNSPPPEPARSSPSSHLTS
jgi:hypothetical protein